MEERQQNLAELSRNISCKLLDSKNLLDILEEIIDGDCKTGTLISALKHNINSSFYEIEECRQKICVID